MVVTRRSDPNDTGETHEEPVIDNIPAPPEQMQHPFQHPTPMNAGEEFDISEDAGSVVYGSETKETTSVITDLSTMRSERDASPSRGGSEVVHLLSSLHDLSRQMEMTMVDLRAQLGSRLGETAYDAGDYDSQAGEVHQLAPARPHFARVKGVFQNTWSAAVSRLLVVWHVLTVRFPNATRLLKGAANRLRPVLPLIGYVIMAQIAFGVYQTHRRLLEQRRQSLAWV